MPYIAQNKRDTLDPAIDELIAALENLNELDQPDNMEGNINYVFSVVLNRLYTKNYADINNAIGVLNCIALEYYSRFAVPYEAQKAFDNGDVYTQQNDESPVID